MNLEHRIAKLEKAAQMATTEDKDARFRELCRQKAAELQARIVQDKEERP